MDLLYVSSISEHTRAGLVQYVYSDGTRAFVPLKRQNMARKFRCFT